MTRVHIILTESQERDLDAIAAQLQLELMPHHASRAGHGWNRTATIIHLIDTYWESQDLLDKVSQGIDSILSPHGVHCSIQNGTLHLEFGGESYEVDF